MRMPMPFRIDPYTNQLEKERNHKMAEYTEEALVETQEVRLAKQSLEILGLTLLVSTPSALNTAWMNAQSPADAVKALDQLNFSPVMKQVAAQFLTQHFVSRAVFFGFGKLHAAFYGGSGEHPVPPDAKRIIEALRNLDHSVSTKS
jgi:hypothetical protein